MTVFGDYSKIQETDIKKYYDTHQSEFMSPEEVIVKQICFNMSRNPQPNEEAEIKKKANDVLSKIKDGKLSFEEAVIQFSDDKISARKGGKIKVRKGVRSKKFDEMAFGFIKPDEISNVFKEQYNFTILQFVSKKESKQKSYIQVNWSAKRKLQQERRTKKNRNT